jgi:PadR family transcriptional regulator PadR
MKTSKLSPAALTNFLRGNTDILVLSILKDGPSHGYGIAFEIERRSLDMLKFKLNTLYPVLHDLERNKLIESDWVVTEGERPKRVYQITEKGVAQLSEKLEAFQEFSLAVFRVAGGHEQKA